MLVLPLSVSAHGGSTQGFRTKILKIEPAGLPVAVKIIDGDQVRFENAGDKELLICGYEGKPGDCQEWVRIGPEGVFVDRNSRTYFANKDDTKYGEIPSSAGAKPKWELLRKRPPFFTSHDHRVHWMGIGLPPNVDPTDPTPQKVFDADLRFVYGNTEAVVKTRLEYIGGKTWFQRRGEQLFIVLGVALILTVFTIDYLRRRKNEKTKGVLDAAD